MKMTATEAMAETTDRYKKTLACMHDFDPTENRIQTMHLTDEERAILEAAISANGGEFSYWIRPFAPLNGKTSWLPEYIYRAKPAPRPTIICNGVEVPEPVRPGADQFQTYFFASPLTEPWFQRSEWTGDYMDKRLLARGLIHLTEADAVAHARAMVLPGMKEGVL